MVPVQAISLLQRIARLDDMALRTAATSAANGTYHHVGLFALGLQRRPMPRPIGTCQAVRMTMITMLAMITMIASSFASGVAVLLLSSAVAFSMLTCVSTCARACGFARACVCTSVVKHVIKRPEIEKRRC